MVHDDKYETSNCSKISFEPFEKFILQIVREICRFVPKLFVPLVQKFGQQVQKWGGKKQKKSQILLNFRKVACSFDRFPTIVVVGVEGNGWKDSCGEVRAAAARRV